MQLSAPAPRMRSAETWARAREAYLQGAPGPELCERFGLGRTAFRERARKEGWRRADQSDPDPDLDALADEEDEDAPVATPGETAELAWRKVARAAKAGRLHESLGWMRLCREAGQLAACGFDADCRRAEADARRIRQAADAATAVVRAEAQALLQIDRLGRKLEGAGRVGADSPDSTDSDSTPPLLNRAARRRAVALARKADGRGTPAPDSG